MAATRNTQWMEFLYIALAVLGLAATNVQLAAYLKLGYVAANVQFWKETAATPASTFILVDIFVLATAVLTWMFGECRRLGIAARWAWVYFLGSSLIGISCFFPLFLAHRHRRLRLNHPDQQAVPGGADFIAVAMLIVSTAYVALYSFSHIPHG